MLRARTDESRVWGRMDTCLCMAESLCCPPETITTLLTDCTPIQNASGIKKIIKVIIHWFKKSTVFLANGSVTMGI